MNREQERKYLEESPEVAAYLSHMGLRPESDGFRFLLFVINQLRRGIFAISREALCRFLSAFYCTEE